jgi:TolB-like protein
VRQNPIGAVIAFALAAIVGVALTIVYVNKWEGSRQSSPATEATSVISPPKNSIAVLPFVNISGDAKQEYFSDGLSEELIDHLVHNTQLKVIARTSSFEFKGKTGDVRAIAKILSVSHLLEGSVRTEGQQLRITAQLVRGSDGVQIWSQTYNRDLGGIFKIQDEISERVAEALKATLRDNQATISRETDIRAYNLVLEGNYLKGRRNLVDAGRAAELYQQAIKIDPTYALAWARLASAFLVEEILRGQPSEEQNKLVVDALNHAIAIDPNLEWAYYTRAGFQGSIMWDWPAALADTEHVRNIDPRFAYLPSAFGDIELAFGEINKAVEFYRDGLTRSPLDPNMLNTMGAALCAAGRIAECLQVRLTLLQLYPEFGGVNRSIGMTYMYLGRLEEALKSMQAEPDMDLKLSGLSLIYWAMGRHSDSYAALESLTARSGATIPYNIATVHAFRGEVEDAFNWLEKAYRAHDYGMLSLNSDPLLARLRNDPRFHQLLIRMRLYKDVGQSVSRDAKTRDASTYASMPRL